MACIKAHALLPRLSDEYPDAYYELCAAWVLHTHYLGAIQLPGAAGDGGSSTPGQLLRPGAYR